ncbi:MAG TPA: hypothetical protein VGY99_32235 [Candidatus Binataceae bacterium]|jgi:hypothetical protein|nr:hypothetical protein [Candidatus Binataceae bacterium]
MTPDAYSWEIGIGTRPTWRCSRCGFRSPCWCGADNISLCAACEAKEREAAHGPLRCAIAADRRANARRDAANLGPCEVVREAEKVFLFETSNGARQWVPKSLVVAIDEVTDEVFVRMWFYIKFIAPRFARAA